MPQFLEDALRKEAAKQGKSGKGADHYTYGALNNMGAMHGSQETAKGRAMQKKHDAKPRGKGRASNNVTRKAR